MLFSFRAATHMEQGFHVNDVNKVLSKDEYYQKLIFIDNIGQVIFNNLLGLVLESPHEFSKRLNILNCHCVVQASPKTATATMTVQP